MRHWLTVSVGALVACVGPAVTQPTTPDRAAPAKPDNPCAPAEAVAARVDALIAEGWLDAAERRARASMPASALDTVAGKGDAGQPSTARAREAS